MATSSEIQSRCDQAQLGVLDVIHDGIHDVGVPPEGRLASSGVGLRGNCEVRVVQLLKCVKKTFGFVRQSLWCPFHVPREAEEL